MVTFEQFMQNLAFGQMKQTAAVDDDLKSEIIPTYWEQVMNLTNQGLLDLSTKMPVISKQVDLIFETGVSSYPMVVATYLDDTGLETWDPDSFLSFLDIFDEEGCRHPHDTNGHIVTPKYNTLRFTADKMDELGDRVRIRYQSKHNVITANTDFIDLPQHLVTALQNYVAGMYLIDIGSPESVAKGDRMYGMYLQALGEDEAKNTSATSEVHEDYRFYEKGFV